MPTTPLFDRGGGGGGGRWGALWAAGGVDERRNPRDSQTGGLSVQAAAQMMAKAGLNRMFAQIILDEGLADLRWLVSVCASFAQSHSADSRFISRLHVALPQTGQTAQRRRNKAKSIFNP